MDTLKLSEVLGQLQSLLGGHKGGEQWAQKDVPKQRPHAWGEVHHDWTLGVLDNWEILEQGEALRLYALGLTHQPRLRRRDEFVCSGAVATKEFSEQCLGGMELDERCIALNQTLITRWQHLLGRRTLLATPNEHVGRKVRVAWKIDDGLTYQLGYQLPKPFTIQKHLATCLWLDRVPEPYQGAGYLCLIFE